MSLTPLAAVRCLAAMLGCKLPLASDLLPVFAYCRAVAGSNL